jgi:hypothetical protein
MSSSTRALAASSQKRARDSNTLRRTTKPQKDPRSQCIMEPGSGESEIHSLFGSRETQVSRFNRVRIQRTRHYQTTGSGNGNKEPRLRLPQLAYCTQSRWYRLANNTRTKKRELGRHYSLVYSTSMERERVAEGTKVRALGLHLKVRQSTQKSTVGQPQRIRG